MDDLLRYVLRQALRYSSADTAACLLALPDATVSSPELRAVGLSRGAGRCSADLLSRWVAEIRTSRWGLDAREPRLLDEPGRLFLKDESRSALLIPLLQERRSLGFLQLERREPREGFAPPLAPLQSLAAEAVPAIHRLLLREPCCIGSLETDLVGLSPAVRAFERQLLHAARYDRAPVLITGERGSGKELAAWAIHCWSPRRRRPFVPVLMSALPDNLGADELFGHERHAFTGAEDQRIGKFAAAAGGTLFLDEVADINLPMQAALLRVVENNEVSRLGRDFPVHIDTRVIAATNQDLPKAVREGRFRADLYDRLAMFKIDVPSLRERREDLPLLADYFLKRYCVELQRRTERAPGNSACKLCRRMPGAGCVSPDFYQALSLYDWPGNVRELKHAMFRLMATVKDETLEPRHLPELFQGRPVGGDRAAAWNLDAAIRRHIEAVLELTGHNKTRAAQLLGIPYTTFQSKLRKLGMLSKALSARRP
jgi:DNA-binding NtrC family response regulator